VEKGGTWSRVSWGQASDWIRMVEQGSGLTAPEA